ncbi:hypothetical protein C1645_744491 [Glomus cerebriforme]|uniref:Uncharacterized protein n=1 Tax=Glomus cerebriforme TaxID=658196 RepID=A0A397S9I2_9GLOM|nr:hypothetical protein C1645_744491 [Glomus cerebriforme]
MGIILSNNRTQKMKRDKNYQITSDFCMYTTMVAFGEVEVLLRDVLDPAAEEIQYAKNKLPENTPEWAYDAEKIRNEATDVKMLKYGVNNNNDKMTQYDNVSLTDSNLDYLLNSAEMNLIWSEDLDEIGKSSQSPCKYLIDNLDVHELRQNLVINRVPC